ncbi:hypothetical protein [Halohasta litorea]|uniref:Uncharacterized protein n=1 Tax=Halohasta litorea TaxID=869891 RepID=A0ABD6D478_9EURY|nr:hypothetical protein [Halohasta litorea]
MSADRADTVGVSRRLPSRATVREGLLTLVYLITLVVGSSLLVTLELVVRL